MRVAITVFALVAGTLFSPSTAYPASMEEVQRSIRPCASFPQGKECRSLTDALQLLSLYVTSPRARQEVGVLSRTKTSNELCRVGREWAIRSNDHAVSVWKYLTARQAEWSERMQSEIVNAAMFQAQHKRGRVHSRSEAIEYISATIDGAGASAKCGVGVFFAGLFFGRKIEEAQSIAPGVIEDIIAMVGKGVGRNDPDAKKAAAAILSIALDAS